VRVLRELQELGTVADVVRVALDKGLITTVQAQNFSSGMSRDAQKNDSMFKDEKAKEEAGKVSLGKEEEGEEAEGRVEEAEGRVEEAEGRVEGGRSAKKGKTAATETAAGSRGATGRLARHPSAKGAYGLAEWGPQRITDLAREFTEAAKARAAAGTAAKIAATKAAKKAAEADAKARVRRLVAAPPPAGDFERTEAAPPGPSGRGPATGAAAAGGGGGGGGAREGEGEGDVTRATTAALDAAAALRPAPVFPPGSVAHALVKVLETRKTFLTPMRAFFAAKRLVVANELKLDSPSGEPNWSKAMTFSTELYRHTADHFCHFDGRFGLWSWGDEKIRELLVEASPDPTSEVLLDELEELKLVAGHARAKATRAAKVAETARAAAAKAAKAALGAFDPSDPLLKTLTACLAGAPSAGVAAPAGTALVGTSGAESTGEVGAVQDAVAKTTAAEEAAATEAVAAAAAATEAAAAAAAARDAPPRAEGAAEQGPSETPPAAPSFEKIDMGRLAAIRQQEESGRRLIESVREAMEICAFIGPEGKRQADFVTTPSSPASGSAAAGERASSSGGAAGESGLAPMEAEGSKIVGFLGAFRKLSDAVSSRLNQLEAPLLFGNTMGVYSLLHGCSSFRGTGNRAPGPSRAQDASARLLIDALNARLGSELRGPLKRMRAATTAATTATAAFGAEWDEGFFGQLHRGQFLHHSNLSGKLLGILQLIRNNGSIVKKLAGEMGSDSAFSKAVAAVAAAAAADLLGEEQKQASSGQRGTRNIMSLLKEASGALRDGFEGQTGAKEAGARLRADKGPKVSRGEWEKESSARVERETIFFFARHICSQPLFSSSLGHSIPSPPTQNNSSTARLARPTRPGRRWMPGPSGRPWPSWCRSRRRSARKRGWRRSTCSSSRSPRWPSPSDSSTSSSPPPSAVSFLLAFRAIAAA